MHHQLTCSANCCMQPAKKWETDLQGRLFRAGCRGRGRLMGSLCIHLVDIGQRQLPHQLQQQIQKLLFQGQVQFLLVTCSVSSNTILAPSALPRERSIYHSIPLKKRDAPTQRSVWISSHFTHFDDTVKMLQQCQYVMLSVGVCLVRVTLAQQCSMR